MLKFDSNIRKDITTYIRVPADLARAMEMQDEQQLVIEVTGKKELKIKIGV